MSEEILKALMEMFALVVKQDGGILSNEREYVFNFLNKQLTKRGVNDYLNLFDEHAGPVMETHSKGGSRMPSVKDSVKMLGICKKINRTLNQEQKVVVLMRLFELVNADRQFTAQRMNIINTVAEVFKISSDEFASIEQFVKNDEPDNLKNPLILILEPGRENCKLSDSMQSGYQDTTILILHVETVDIYFIKYLSKDQLYLNGLPISAGNVYTFASGGAVKTQSGHAIYFSDISSTFLSGIITNKISFTVENLSFFFKEGQAAVHNVNFSIEEGKLVGILGASGSGKTTLLNLMSGIQKPSAGRVTINGLDIQKNHSELEGVFGYVPQDDTLIEDLTVFENLYFAACQCFKSKSKEEISLLVDNTLRNLGLLEKSNLKVGSSMNKVISGGQRKRLNIALELIREPSVLFLDEPTSGLSSRDSENLMDLLRDLTLKGKLIFTVIHQPSSEIFKMFDKVIILDQGGCMAYSGNPVDSVIYFKTLESQINALQGECPSCGTVNPETIFNIIETQIVDEFGKYTEKRRVKPIEWASTFSSKNPFKKVPEVKEPPHNNMDRPGLYKQFKIYFTRDFKSKLANSQYVAITFLEAPLLGFILSYIIRYIPDPASKVYIFSENENIPIYIFMSIIVALFLGLTISAEEIFRDRKILKREKFLNLSRTSYLLSKIAILALISAFQTLTFVMIANPILGISGLYFQYWLALFTTSFCANMIGLNISASFNSAITIYIVIPLLIIPMMVLSGAMFSFDKLNRVIGNVENVPVIAEIMPTRWTYEALMVTQFKDNRYSRVEFSPEGDTYYLLQKKLSEADFNKVYRIPELNKALETTLFEYRSNPQNIVNKEVFRLDKTLQKFSKLLLLKNELTKISEKFNIRKFKYLDDLTPYEFNPGIADSLVSYLREMNELFGKISNSASDMRDRFYNANDERLNEFQNDYYNYKLEEIVTKYYERKKVLLYNNSLVQNTDPIFLDPDKKGLLNFRTHFYAPSKYFLGIKFDTYKFNISLVLFSLIFLYLTLYFDIIRKCIRMFEKFKFQKKRNKL